MEAQVAVYLKIPLSFMGGKGSDYWLVAALYSLPLGLGPSLLNMQSSLFEQDFHLIPPP